MTQVHQLVHTLNYGDAISGEALTIHRLLERRGINSKIYSVHAHEMVRGYVTNWSSFHDDCAIALKNGEQVIAILHYSIASPLNQLILSVDGLQRALIYHNLTPTFWFEGYNQRVVSDLLRGRDELPTLLKQIDVIWADSPYNAEELKEFGCKDARVLPLPLDAEKWSVPANLGISRILKSTGGVNLLHVGRLAPNKCVEDIIKAFYFYHHKIERNSRLWLVGIDIDTEIYSFELRRLVSRLHLKDAVNFVGAVADAELRGFYENCQLYLCMSEHEGFCLPLLEAMSFGMPIIAFDSTAVGTTVGDAGVLLKRKHPAEIAELINILQTDARLRNELVAKGKERAREFLTLHFEQLFNRELVERFGFAKCESGSPSVTKNTINAAHWS